MKWFIAAVAPQIAAYGAVSFVMWDVAWLGSLAQWGVEDRASALFFWFLASAVATTISFAVADSL